MLTIDICMADELEDQKKREVGWLSWRSNKEEDVNKAKSQLP